MSTRHARRTDPKRTAKARQATLTRKEERNAKFNENGKNQKVHESA